MPAEETLKIFLCYRRDDSGGDTGRIRDKLVSVFGDENIYMDVDSKLLEHAEWHGAAFFEVGAS